MNHICYFYIFDYRSIRNMGISLDARYTYEWDTDGKVLNIRESENKDYIDGFWPEGVSSLAAIVGNNGTGKTSFLEAMLHILAHGGGEWLAEVLVIYKNDGISGLSAYCSKDGYNVYFNGNQISINDKKIVNDAPNLNPFYYSSTFRPFTSVLKAGQGEIGDGYNATDTWKLIKDPELYTNVDTEQGNLSIGFYLQRYQYQDDNRIVQLLADKELRNAMPKNALPQYIIIRKSVAGFDHLVNNKLMPKTPDGRVRKTSIKLLGTKDDRVAEIVYNCFYSIAADYPDAADKILDDQSHWYGLFNSSKSVISSLQNLSAICHTITKKYIDILIEISKFLLQKVEHNQNTGTLYINLLTGDKESEIEQLMKFFKESLFIVGHYFDLSFSRDTSENTQLSSGELDTLKLFSRLHDALKLTPDKFANKRASHLLLIDEAENSYHPEWQRQFVSRLLGFVHALHERYKRVNKDVNFQLVLTTHSPILLSDIPVMCTNYLLKEEENSHVRLLHDRHETFGANIYDLYKDSFFMSGGLVGAYAYQKIQELREEIEKEQDWSKEKAEELTRRVDMIGDKVIRHYLLSRIEEKHKLTMVAYYKRKLKELGGE